MLRGLCPVDSEHGLTRFADRSDLEVQDNDSCVMVSEVVQKNCYDFEMCRKRTVDHVDGIEQVLAIRIVGGTAVCFVFDCKRWAHDWLQPVLMWSRKRDLPLP